MQPPPRKVKGVMAGITRTITLLLVCCALASAIALPSLDLPGIYYDEVIQVEPALAFLRGEPPPEIPGLRVLPGTQAFPWMTQPYMGALKSQMLVPLFAVIEPTATSLRAATLAVALAGLCLWTLFARRTLGETTAWVGALLLASDPSFLFIARHDWGSFSLGFLLRGAAVLTLWTAHRTGGIRAGLFGGICLGLGLYNKVDFAVFLVAAAAALALVARHECRALLTERPRWLIATGIGFVLGMAPLAASLPEIARTSAAFSTAGGGVVGELLEKLVLTRQVLDGSYFHRLMLTGGDFLTLHNVPDAAHGLGAIALVLSLAVLVISRARKRVESGSQLRAIDFIIVATVASFFALLLLPRGVRIHHTLNAWPFPQLVVASALVWLASRGAAFRGLAIAIAVVIIAANVRVDVAIHRTLADTQGKGRWSRAISGLADDASGPIVALDWGFAGPLRFTRPELDITEPIWILRRQRPAHVGLALSGTANHRYLAFEPEHAVYPFGDAFLEAIAALPEDRVAVVKHPDGQGIPVFREVRLLAPHRLIYRAGHFEVRFE